MRIILILFTILWGCKRPDETQIIEREIDTRLEHIVNDFFDQAKSHGVTTGFWPSVKEVIMIDKIDDDKTVGVCYPNFIRRIEILEGMEPLSEQSTVWHELGHCVYELDHHEDTIMSEANFSEQEYSERLPELKETFWELVPEEYKVYHSN